MLESELVDRVNVITQKTYDPLEWTNVGVSVNCFLEVWYDRVLPLVRFLKCMLETGRFRPNIAAEIDIVVNFSLGNVSK